MTDFNKKQYFYGVENLIHIVKTMKIGKPNWLIPEPSILSSYLMKPYILTTCDHTGDKWEDRKPNSFTTTNESLPNLVGRPKKLFKNNQYVKSFNKSKPCEVPPETYVPIEYPFYNGRVPIIDSNLENTKPQKPLKLPEFKELRPVETYLDQPISVNKEDRKDDYIDDIHPSHTHLSNESLIRINKFKNQVSTHLSNFRTSYNSNQDSESLSNINLCNFYLQEIDDYMNQRYESNSTVDSVSATSDSSYSNISIHPYLDSLANSDVNFVFPFLKKDASKMNIPPNSNTDQSESITLIDVKNTNETGPEVKNEFADSSKVNETSKPETPVNFNSKPIPKSCDSTPTKLKSSVKELNNKKPDQVFESFSTKESKFFNMSESVPVPVNSLASTQPVSSVNSPVSETVSPVNPEEKNSKTEKLEFDINDIKKSLHKIIVDDITDLKSLSDSEGNSKKVNILVSDLFSSSDDGITVEGIEMLPVNDDETIQDITELFDESELKDFITKIKISGPIISIMKKSDEKDDNNGPENKDSVNLDTGEHLSNDNSNNKESVNENMVGKNEDNLKTE